MSNDRGVPGIHEWASDSPAGIHTHCACRLQVALFRSGLQLMMAFMIIGYTPGLRTARVTGRYAGFETVRLARDPGTSQGEVIPPLKF